MKKKSVKMTIQYLAKEFEEIRIFGDEFVRNNKHICKIIINEKKHELVPYLKVKSEYLSNGVSIAGLFNWYNQE